MHPLTRSQAAQLGREAVAIAAEGRYRRVDGAVVDIGDAVRRCVASTRVIRPDDWPAVLRRGREAAPRDAAARAEVTQETTLAAARRLVEQENAARPLVLNFASAKSPGGGFLGGSRAQEESLARSSALYASLQRAGAYYDQNRACGSSLYTDHAVLSPDVPVFRADDGAPLDRPYAASFLTMPAVNVGALGRSGEHARVEPVMAGRVEKVLALAAAEGFDTLSSAPGAAARSERPAPDRPAVPRRPLRRRLLGVEVRSDHVRGIHRRHGARELPGVRRTVCPESGDAETETLTAADRAESTGEART